MDKRIGTYNADGSIKEYPQVSLAGQAFDNTQDRLGIGNGQFVILDRFLTASARDELLAQLKPPSLSKDKA